MFALASKMWVEYAELGMQFETKFDPSTLKYGLFAAFARNAHCDPDFLKHSLETEPAADLETSCGFACRDMLQYTSATTMTVDYHYNEVDHTQFISFKTNTSFPISSAVSTTKVFAFRGTVFY